MATTRDEALALVRAYAARTYPASSLAVVEETRGGGLNGPWVFQLASPAPPLLVHDRSSDVIELAPSPHGLRAAVVAWEVTTYGHAQR